MSENQEVNSEEVTYHYSYKPQKQKKEHRVVRTILLCILVFDLALLGGYLGSSYVIKKYGNKSQTVVYQSVDRPENSNPGVVVSGSNIVKDINDKNADSVVVITTEKMAYSLWMTQYVVSGAGSGVIISSDGYIVTCAHVVEDATKVTVTLNNGKVYDATVIGEDKENDTAVIKVDANDLTPVIIGDSSKLFVGEVVVAIGNPLGNLGGTVTDGIVSALEREITIDGQSFTLIQTNAAINPGNSGGALFNEYGELIGIVNAKSSGSDVEGLGFAIPINTVKGIIEDLISKGYVTGKRQLGITVVDISTKQLAQKYGYDELGIFITEIAPGSIAEAEGLKVGDKIISINSINLDSIDTLKNLYGNISAGETVNIKIKRNHVEQVISFTKE